MTQQHRFFISLEKTGDTFEVFIKLYTPDGKCVVSNSGPFRADWMIGEFDWMWARMGRDIKELISAQTAKDREEAGR